MPVTCYDKIILGAGLYGLYAALFCARQGDRVLVLEYDDAPFKRATYINQARVHMGYHYPRSYSTALKSARYFDRFNRDFGYCIHSSFDQIYATSAHFSWTDGEEFRKFCRGAGIRCDDVAVSKYFKPGMCDGAFLTTEYTYDAMILRDHLLAEIREMGEGITMMFGVRLERVEKGQDVYRLFTEEQGAFETPFLVNATYASVNQVQALLGQEPFGIKYELCEIIICSVAPQLKDTGITVMDGPFFSIMPFGKTGYHSLTSVTFTPHVTSYDPLPTFGCQGRSGGFCSPQRLGNCNECPAKPASAWSYMSGLARKYLREELGFRYEYSLFSMKPILKASELDDSRPTLVRTVTQQPTFVSVLSGKINTVYDLEEVLSNGRP